MKNVDKAFYTGYLAGLVSCAIVLAIVITLSTQNQFHPDNEYPGYTNMDFEPPIEYEASYDTGYWYEPVPDSIWMKATEGCEMLVDTTGKMWPECN